MVKYKYTENTGVMTFQAFGKSYTVGKHDSRLKDTVELPKKVNIPGLELVEELKKNKNKGDE